MKLSSTLIVGLLASVPLMADADEHRSANHDEWGPGTGPGSNEPNIWMVADHQEFGSSSWENNRMTTDSYTTWCHLKKKKWPIGGFVPNRSSDLSTETLIAESN